MFIIEPKITLYNLFEDGCNGVRCGACSCILFLHANQMLALHWSSVTGSHV